MIGRAYLKSHFLVSALLFAVALLAVILLVVIPSLREIRVINKQVYDERVRLERLYVKGQLQKRVRENFARIKGEVAFLDEILLKENNELPYITALEQASDESGVELKINVGERKRTPNQPLSSLEFTLEVKGDWQGLARFLDKLESLPYYTNIKETTFAVRQEKESPGRTVDAAISADTSWLIKE